MGVVPHLHQRVTSAADNVPEEAEGVADSVASRTRSRTSAATLATTSPVQVITRDDFRKMFTEWMGSAKSCREENAEMRDFHGKDIVAAGAWPPGQERIVVAALEGLSSDLQRRGVVGPGGSRPHKFVRYTTELTDERVRVDGGLLGGRRRQLLGGL